MLKEIKININGKEYFYPKGTSLLDISRDFSDNYKNKILAGVVDNVLRELDYTIEKDCNIDFLDLTTTDGQKIYKRSLSFLFVKAVEKVLPDAKVKVANTINKGIFCEIDTDVKLDENIVKKIKDQMIALVKEDIPFIKENMAREEAIKYFQEKGCYDKVSLLLTREKEGLKVYTCNGHKNLFYGYLVPSTGFLDLFDIVLAGDGIAIISPRKNNPNTLLKYIPQPKLLHIFEERRQWNKIMGVHLIGDLNKVIMEGDYRELIRIVEILHTNKINDIADEIVRLKNKRIILISGPSSSGKTTFSKRLALHLKVHGLSPVAISLDDYFVNRELTPKDEFGNYDFESPYCMDLELFNRHLLKLIEGKEIELPTFNFKEGRREYRGNKLQVREDQPIILEGIHALNPILTEMVDDSLKYKIYISALAQLNLDYHNRISTTDLRFIRRMVRDAQFRGIDAKSTINLWPSVRRGEEKYIFPFQENADIMFNSSLSYEIPVLKKYVVPLLNKITPADKEFLEANRLLSLVSHFKEIEDENDIPPTSILKEFIGNSRIVH